MNKSFFARCCCVFRSKDFLPENRGTIVMLYRTIVIFVVIEIIEQTGLYVSYSCFEKFQQGALGILLLSGLGFIALFMSYMLIQRAKAHNRDSKYKTLLVYLVLSCGLTVISSECSPWTLLREPPSLNALEDIMRFQYMKNFKIFVLSVLFVRQEKSLRLGVIVYLIPFIYLALRLETYGKKSLEILVIPTILLIFAPRLFLNSDTKTKGPTGQEGGGEKSRLNLDENAKAEETVKAEETAKAEDLNNIQSFDNYFTLFNALQDGAMVLDDCGRPIYTNEALLKILECSYDEAVEKVFKLSDKEFASQKNYKKEAPRKFETSYPSLSNLQDRLDMSASDSILQDLPSTKFKRNHIKQSPFQLGSAAASNTDSFASPMMSSKDERSGFANENILKKYLGNAKKLSKKPEPSSNQSNSTITTRKAEYIMREPGLSDNVLISHSRKSPHAASKLTRCGSPINHESLGPNSRNSLDNFKSEPNEESLLRVPLPLIQSKFAKTAEESKEHHLAVPVKKVRMNLKNFELNSQTKTNLPDSVDEAKTHRGEELPLQSIEQIAEQQALSMKPELDDLLEKLQSNNIRSSFATVGDAIQHVFLKHFNKGNNGRISNCNLIADIDLQAEDCVRSASEGVMEYLIGKKGTLLLGSSVIINSYLKASATKVKYLEVKISPLVHKDHKLLLVLIRDDTQKDIARRLHLLDKQKASALASTVHDLRAPLGAIMSSLECISSKAIDAEILDSFVKPASYAAKSLMFLINEILDIHQINMNKLKLSFQRCDITSTLRSTAEIFRFKAESKGLELKVAISDDTPQHIVTDANRLQQVVINLLSNALKFTEKGSITVHTALFAERMVRVAVSDTGIGIKEQDRMKLFTNFGRIRNQKNDMLNPQGVGLGLVISNKLAKMLCQNEAVSGLKVESGFGKGSEFYFMVEDCDSEDSPQSGRSKSEGITDLARVRPSEIKRTMNSINYTLDKSIFEEEAGNFLASPISPSRNRDKKTCTCSRILVVDDNEFSVVATINILKSLNIQNVEKAGNGQEALDTIVKRSSQNPCCKTYDLILMDCQMPVMDGIAATAEIQKLIKANQIGSQRILGLSGYSSEEIQNQCKQAGMMKVLVKPLHLNDLKFLIQN